MSVGRYARKYAKLGWWVLPVKTGEKHPYVEWTAVDSQPVQQWEQGSSWDRKARGLWLVCGTPSRVVVLDIDSEQADRAWHDRLGPELERTACARTRKGHHYFFSLAEGEVVSSAWDHELGWDFQSDGRGVILPPSRHADDPDLEYTWVRDPVRFPPVALPALLAATARQRTESATEGNGEGSDGKRSNLAELLANPPKEGGRNTWLTQVAGHLAASMRHKPDAVRELVLSLNRLLDPPLEDTEVQKTLGSILKSELAKEGGTDAPEADNGWLVGHQDQLWTTCKAGQETILLPWSDHDLTAMGVATEGDRLTFDVELRKQRGGVPEHHMIDSHDLADPRRLARWMLGRGVTILEPSGMTNRGSRGERLARYLLAQNPPEFQVVRSLGWDGEAFICHEGRITADGLVPHNGVRPAFTLRNTAPYHYGTRSTDEARNVLNEVLSFHFTEEAAVFGSWWAACLLKPQISRYVSQFPIMAIEAPSESGKTRGMFGLLIQLAGNLQPQGIWTAAALRDALAAHHSGIVWVDDQDSINHIHELLRAVTTGGSVTKKGEDFSQVEVELVAPLVLSGESLGLRDQKALLDRTLLLNVRTPTKRRSTRDPKRPQWDDIVALRHRFGDDLTCFAGDIVALALQQQAVVDETPVLRGSQGSRYADKVAVIRVGSRLLAGMTGDPGWVDAVDAWVDSMIDYVEEDNTLTQKLLPTCLSVIGLREVIEHDQDKGVPTPVIVRKGRVLYNPRHLAMWWENHQRGRIVERTESLEAIRLQTKTAGAVQAGAHRIAGAPDRRTVRMLALPLDLSKLVLDRAGIQAEEELGYIQDGLYGG